MSESTTHDGTRSCGGYYIVKDWFLNILKKIKPKKGPFDGEIICDVDAMYNCTSWLAHNKRFGMYLPPGFLLSTAVMYYLTSAAQIFLPPKNLVESQYKALGSTIL